MTFEQDLSDRQTWSRAVEAGMAPADLATITTPMIRKTDSVAAVGTILAARLLAAMRKKASVIRVEPPHPAFAELPPEAGEYTSFSASYGEVWSARALRQLVRRADRSFVPGEDRRHEGDIVVDAMRPDLRYPARSDQEFEVLTDRHLNAVRSAFRRCSRLIVSLGGSEVCETIADGTVLPILPGDAAFDPDRHAFRTLSVDETIDDLTDAIRGLRALNPGMAIILMVSPEPIAATATPTHVAAANTLGKAVLRVAMEEATARRGIWYFPALEIAARLGERAFAGDGRTLTAKALSLIGTGFLELCEGGSIERVATERVEPEEPEVAEEAPGLDIASTAADLDASALSDMTAEERRAARQAHRDSMVAERVAAREAARNAARADEAAPAPSVEPIPTPPPRSPTPPPPPPPPLRKPVVPKVIDAYTDTVPANARPAKPKGPRRPKVQPPEPDTSIVIGGTAARNNAEARDPAAEKARAGEERRKRRAERAAAQAAPNADATAPQRARRNEGTRAASTSPASDASPSAKRRAKAQTAVTADAPVPDADKSAANAARRAARATRRQSDDPSKSTE